MVKIHIAKFKGYIFRGWITSKKLILAQENLNGTYSVILYNLSNSKMNRAVYGKTKVRGSALEYDKQLLYISRRVLYKNKSFKGLKDIAKREYQKRVKR